MKRLETIARLKSKINMLEDQIVQVQLDCPHEESFTKDGKTLDEWKNLLVGCGEYAVVLKCTDCGMSYQHSCKRSYE